MTPTPLRRPGITPIELIVLLAGLLLLIGFLAPAVAKVREAAARTQSMNNMKQLGIAMHNFAGVYNSKLPPGVGECDFVKKTGTIHLFLLPFIEQDQLYRQATDAVWDNDVWSKPIPVLVDPRDPLPSPHVYQGWLATTNYAANYMVFSEKPRYKIGNIPDGTSNTISFVTRYQMCDGTPTAWGYPSSYTWAPLTAYYHQSLPQFSLRDEPCDPTRAQAINNAMLAGLCDGSVRTISPRLSATTWRNALQPDDGNPLGEDWNF
jgi:hypothetical protein